MTQQNGNPRRRQRTRTGSAGLSTIDLADALPLIVWEAEARGGVAFYNRHFYEYTGLTEEEAHGTGWRVTIHPDDLDVALESRAVALSSGAPWRFEYRLRRADGAWRWHLAQAAPVRDPQTGAVLRWVGTATDVEDGKAAESALREGHLRLRELADAMPQIVWTARAEGGADWFNRRWYEYTGMTEAESLSGDSGRAVHPDDRPVNVREWERARAAGDAWQCEYRLRRADGTYRWFLGRLVPVRGADGDIRRWVGTATDITERKQEERRQRFLSAITERTRSLLDPSAVLWEAAQATGEFLGLDRCMFADVEVEAGRIAIERDFRAPGVPSVAGTFPVSAWGRIGEDLCAGRTMVLPDCAADPRTADAFATAYGPAGIAAFVAVPLRREGRWVGVFSGHSSVPRGWTADEVELMEAVAERTWLAVENARLYQETRRKEERFGALVEASGQIVWHTDALGRIEDIPRWRAYTGQGREEAAGWGWLDAIHPAERERVRRAWLVAVGNRRPFAAEFRLRGADGAYRWFAARGVPLVGADGALREYIGSAQSVDAQRRVEEERAEFAAKQQRIAETLQRSLLITPAAGRRPFAGLEVCPIYEPASDDMLVGGDFFDAFALPGGKTALVVGDMTGKGLDAAGRTAEIKFALRALLREHAGAPPALTLSLLNRHLVASEELDGRSGADVFACVALAVADPAAGTVALALAGMEPPLLLRAAAGGEPEPLDVGGVILGAIPDWDYGDGPAEFALLPGDVLMLFTDGLTEARRPHGELFGPARAASAVRDALTAGATLAEAGAAALEAARSFAGGRAQDDVCLLLARREESPIR